ncbi:type VII secretion protein [Streptococcus acidominimus]|uniref:ESAT-6 secretion system protein EsaB n=1 Tax=Streptococcus acidominimus TaxID=1326 RepID=A0A1Q8EC06_STRAI|nr:type VII secretion protein [Streptococcus acidominimus]MBF0846373.1 type VII secretion protein [Streptococcus danieliae]MBF0818415.1 type VII secretion protein [Streptococcus acidominimus]MBF0838604.1 type VII secretion protein [Streptococcus acidominimus]OLF49336.1 type VII secretion protein [Streptococcus acidominimus]TFU31322.1 type VII secretion protein [Streptococcus acidominimus]
MDGYINVSLDLTLVLNRQFDLRIPASMTLKELLQVVSDSYGLSLQIVNPTARVLQTGQMIASTGTLESLKNGVRLQLENM